MTPRSRRRPVVLVFGEDINDAQTVVELVAHVAPSLSGALRPRPRPTSLTRTATASAVRNWIAAIAEAVVATEAAGTPVRAVLVHQDADGADPRGERHTALARSLSVLKQDAHPVVPVQMTEAWFFLFPDAVESVRPSQWRGKLPRTSRDVETIDDPKRELKRLTRSRRGGLEYQEADAPTIAKNVRRLSPKRFGTSASYDRLLATAKAIEGART